MPQTLINRGRVVVCLALSPVLIAPFWVGAAPPQPFTQAGSPAQVAASLALPRKEGSVRFAVMGDTGSGLREHTEEGKAATTPSPTPTPR